MTPKGAPHEENLGEAGAKETTVVELEEVEVADEFPEEHCRG